MTPVAPCGAYHCLYGLDRTTGAGLAGLEWCQIKVSYDTKTTRLHAKAWLFERLSGYSTAYIGSSNLTHSAMLDASRMERPFRSSRDA